MHKLTIDDVRTPAAYNAIRHEVRPRILEHKRRRRVALGPDITLQFEDDETMRYQLEEMLRVEQIDDPGRIERELAVYNPLIPDGNNWKATLMLQPSGDDPEAQLRRLAGIERHIYMRIGDHPRVWAAADESVPGSGEEVEAVHFLRFELTPEMVAAAKGGADICMGVEHPHYPLEIVDLAETTRGAIASDLH